MRAEGLSVAQRCDSFVKGLPYLFFFGGVW